MIDDNNSLFSGHYHDWRAKRLAKIVSIFGEDFFRGRDILELGCGEGEFGEKFMEFGADLTFCDAREEHLINLKKRLPNSTTHLIDQDEQWDLKRKFDFIIHTGVLYHLSNWKQDLCCALKHSPLIFLETIVPDNGADDYEQVLKENYKKFDQSIHGRSVRPSAAYIEKFLGEQGVRFKRYDDAKINSGVHKYDWVVGGGGNPHGYRRFWILYND